MLEIWCGSSRRIGKSISAKKKEKDLHTFFAFSVLTLQMLISQFLHDKDPFLRDGHIFSPLSAYRIQFSDFEHCILQGQGFGQSK